MVDFLVIGPVNGCLYMAIFNMFEDEILNIGYNTVTDYGDKKVLSYWYSTFDVQKDPIELKCVYDEDRYCRYINYDAINVDRIDDIPADFDGVIGVPITFLFKYDRRQFEIVSFTNAGNEMITIKEDDDITKELKQRIIDWRLHHPVILKDGEYVHLYYRILIKKKK